MIVRRETPSQSTTGEVCPIKAELLEKNTEVMLTFADRLTMITPEKGKEKNRWRFWWMLKEQEN